MSSRSPKAPFDRIVLSTDTNSMFLSLWPYVARGWKKLYGILPAVAVVSPDYFDTEKLDPRGTVAVFPAVEGVPINNVARMARYFMAASYHDEAVVTINDVDLLPLNREYIDGLMTQRKPGTLLCVGTELYTGPEIGKFTIGHMTGEARLFRNLINPGGMRWRELLRSWIGMRVHDHKEDISRERPIGDPDGFSDESLLRALFTTNRVPRTDVRRGFYPYTTRAICRSNWRFEPEKIDDGTIVEAHLLRPYDAHRDQLDPLFVHTGVA